MCNYNYGTQPMPLSHLQQKSGEFEVVCCVSSQKLQTKCLIMIHGQPISNYRRHAPLCLTDQKIDYQMKVAIILRMSGWFWI